MVLFCCTFCCEKCDFLVYSEARSIRTANAKEKIVRIIRAYKLSEPILHYIFINSRELCPEQVCELSKGCELAEGQIIRAVLYVVIVKRT